MPETILTVHHEVGLHARPASLLVQTAKKFDAEIQVCYGGRRANAKSILNVLSLGAEQGAEIAICANGVQADEALEALKRLVESNFEVQE